MQEGRMSQRSDVMTGAFLAVVGLCDIRTYLFLCTFSHCIWG